MGCGRGPDPSTNEPGLNPDAPGSNKPPLTYKDAGVDIDAGDALVERIKPMARSTDRAGVMGGLGGFGGLFALGARGVDAQGRTELTFWSVRLNTPDLQAALKGVVRDSQFKAPLLTTDAEDPNEIANTIELSEHPSNLDAER